MESIPALLPSLLAFLCCISLLPPSHAEVKVCPKNGGGSEPCFCHSSDRPRSCPITNRCVIKSLGMKNGPAPVCEACRQSYGQRQITWTGEACAETLRKQKPGQQTRAVTDHQPCDAADKIASHCKCDPAKETETCTDEEMCVKLKVWHDKSNSIAPKCLECGATANMEEIWIGKKCKAKKEKEEKQRREEEEKRIKQEEESRQAKKEEKERMSAVAVDRTEGNIAENLRIDLTVPACEENPGKKLGEDCLPFEYIENRFIRRMKTLGYNIAEATISGLDTTGGAIIDAGGKVAEGVAAATPHVVKGLDTTGGAIIDGGGKVVNGIITIAPYVVDGLDAAGEALIDGASLLAKGAVTAAPYVRDGAAAASSLAVQGAKAAAPIAAASFSAIGEGALSAASLAAQGVVFITPRALSAALTGAEKLGDAALTGAEMIGNAALAGGGAAVSVAGKAFTPSAETTDKSNPGVIGYLYDKATGVAKYVLSTYHSFRGHTDEQSDQASPGLIVLEPDGAAKYKHSTITEPCEVLNEAHQKFGVNCLPANYILWRRHLLHVEEANKRRTRFQAKNR